MTAFLHHLASLPAPLAYAPFATILAASFLMPAYWFFHGGPDCHETLPDVGWLDERTEVWHGGDRG